MIQLELFPDQRATVPDRGCPERGWLARGDYAIRCFHLGDGVCSWPAVGFIASETGEHVPACEHCLRSVSLRRGPRGSGNPSSAG